MQATAIALTAALSLASLLPGDPLVAGHRGCRALMPENTIPAFAHAIATGAQVLELDLVPTADDHLLVNHDLTIDPVICSLPGEPDPVKPLPVRSITLAQARRYDCGSRQNPSWPRQKTVPGTKMPVFPEVLEKFAGEDIVFLVETKMPPRNSPWYVEPTHFARLIYEQLERFGVKQKVILQSFDHDTLHAMHALDPSIQLALLNPRTHLGDYVTPAEKIGAGWQFINWSILQPADVKALQAAGIRVISGTTDDPEQWKRLKAMGVDMIVTDDPAGLAKFLGKR